jgi:hypothetical protein
MTAASSNDNLKAVYEASNCGTLFAIAMITLPSIWNSYPSSRGASSFEEAFRAIHPITIFGEQLAKEHPDSPDPPHTGDGMTSQEKKESCPILSAAAYKYEHGRLYLLASDSVLKKLLNARAPGSEASGPPRNFPVAISLNGDQELPVRRLALCVENCGMVLLEADARKLKKGKDPAVLQFASDLQGEMVAESRAFFLAQEEAESSLVQLLDSENLHQLNKADEISLKFRDKNKRFCDFLFGWPIGKRVYWLGIEQGQAADAGGLKVRGSNAFLTSRFRWFEADDSGIAAALSFYQERSQQPVLR